MEALYWLYKFWVNNKNFDRLIGQNVNQEYFTPKPDLWKVVFWVLMTSRENVSWKFLKFLEIIEKKIMAEHTFQSYRLSVSKNNKTESKFSRFTWSSTKFYNSCSEKISRMLLMLTGKEPNILERNKNRFPDIFL